LSCINLKVVCIYAHLLSVGGCDL